MLRVLSYLGYMTTSAAENGNGWVADDRNFGARLALVRQRMGWGNVKEAALACGLPVESWRNWERDGRMPRDVVTTTIKIANRTGCDPDWLSGMAWASALAREKLPRLDLNQQPCDELSSLVRRHRTYRHRYGVPPFGPNPLRPISPARWTRPERHQPNRRIICHTTHRRAA